MTDMRLTGGCQCGAVRYVIRETPYQVGICHCRMCQKAVGGPFFASFTVKKGSIEWTRGSPAVFQSSLKMERGFCRDCGTPLYNNWTANEVIHPAIATLDDPSSVLPEFQIGTESRLERNSATMGVLQSRSERRSAVRRNALFVCQRFVQF